MSDLFKPRWARQARLSRGALFGAAALASLFAGVSSTAFAEETPPASAGVAQLGPADLGEVIVTARHRPETAQSVPAALSVVSGDFIAKTNTTNFPQLVRYIPSLQFNAFNPRNTSINIRGLGNASGIAGDSLEPGVGFYVDGVYYARPATTTFDLVDIEQVEVLKGPQGTLFGKNTTAGAINITTAAPSFTPQASGEISGGSYGYLVAKGSVSGPLYGDVLAGRLSVATSRRDGLATNDFNGEKVNGYRNITVRGQLLYTPNDALRVRLIGDYSRQNANCCYQVLAGIVTPPSGRSYLQYAGAFGYTPIVDPFGRHVAADAPVVAKQEAGGVSLQAEWSLPGAVLTSITAWRFWNWFPSNDLDASPLSIIAAGSTNNYENQISQEFRIASTGDNRIDYVGGLYLFREQVTASGIQRYGNAASYFLLGPTVPAIVLDGYGYDSTSSANSKSIAVFGQATVHVTSKLNLIGGLRYTYDDKRGRLDQVTAGGAPLTGPLAALAPVRLAIAAPYTLNATVSGGKPSGQIGVSYQATPDILAYANLARGSRSGAVGLTALPAGATPTIRPETIDSAEIGLKTRWFDRRLTLNVDAFIERDKNYQGNLVVTGTTRTYLANIPEVRAQGFEADLRAEPTRQLSLYASVAYNDAHYVTYTNAPCPLESSLSTQCDLSGRRLALVPLWTSAGGAEYRYPLTLGAREVEAYVGIDDTFHSSTSNGSNSKYSWLPSLNLVDARLGLRAADGQWDVFVWGKNITDEDYYTSLGGGIGNTGALSGALGDPATWGVTVRGRY